MQEFEIASGMMPLRVVLRTGGGRVQATVDDSAAPGVVLLIPAATQLRCDPFILNSTRGTGGRYEFNGVRPGDYYAVALRGSVRKQQLVDFNFVSELVRQGTPVHVEREATVTVDLKFGSVPE